MLEGGLVGRIFSANVLFGYMVPQTVLNRPTWFYKKEEAGGGIVEDMMAHFFDLLRTLVGPIEAVYAAAGHRLGAAHASPTARRSTSKSRTWPA